MSITPITPTIPSGTWSDTGHFSAKTQTLSGSVLNATQQFTVLVQPPAAGSKFVTAYKIVSILAGNIGFARNATPAGMPAAVRDASITAAKIAAAAPERTTAATETTTKLVIHPGA